MDIEKKQLYVTQMRGMFNKRALYSDETRQYKTPFEPEPGEQVTIRFRTMKNNVDAVYFISGSIREPMKVGVSRNGFDYYETQIQAGEEPIHYYFEVICGKIRCYYNKLGVSRELQESYSFCIVPGYKTPDWAKGAVTYQIYVDRFYNGDQSNDVISDEYFYIDKRVAKVEDWSKIPDTMDVNNFYGGDLQGVIDKLDYLLDLGVEVIYLNPIFVSPSNHKYDIQDYDYIDPHFGKIVFDKGELLQGGDNNNSNATRYINRVTNLENLEASNQLFIQLVEEAHKRGMKIILDGVFNHCGSFNKWVDRERIYEKEEGYEKGAYISKESPYHSFFKFHNEHEWPYNEFYDGWWGHDTLPKLNYEDSPKLMEDIMRVARKWVSPPFNADGWRLDVAADLGHSPDYNHKFWREFRRVVKEANPEAIVLAEHYGDARSWLEGDQWDTVMNYDAFMEPVSWFLTGMEKHSDQFRQDLLGNAEVFMDTMYYQSSQFCRQSLETAMNELDNHDHSRFLTRTSHRVGRLADAGTEAAGENVNKAVLREAVVMQMTWPGAPTIYYGDEAGVCGFTDPDSRRTYPWGHEDRDLLRFYQNIISVHKEYPVLIGGSLKFLYKDYNILSYARFNKEEQIIVVVNNRAEQAYVEIPVWEAGIYRTQDTIMEEVFSTNAIGFSAVPKMREVKAGVLALDLFPLSAVVLHRREEEPLYD